MSKKIRKDLSGDIVKVLRNGLLPPQLASVSVERDFVAVRNEYSYRCTFGPKAKIPTKAPTLHHRLMPDQPATFIADVRVPAEENEREGTSAFVGRTLAEHVHRDVLEMICSGEVLVCQQGDKS